ncbi:dephospho-CoA kinase [Helicobacter sp. MIT 14-3879]|uniref:dephospho-CoA kinase n=1 Tax=Helicobacter sp. MIT 14-3879 TaxID=2040649 RepID=UPI000E1E86C5|nr:dephospho-CoA kinase [Helicobacter sp. MIT 14-3879]RDU61368.1 dephospho-CoA kinase [Helicobacter sp. MIT 14-3879]
MQYANILTGSIGCGKSTVSRFLALEGFSIIDADTIAHEVLEQEKDTVVQAFGNHILKQDTHSKTITINRKALAQIIFNDSKKKRLLESILHPIIQKNILSSCKQLEVKKVPYFIEIPLYFESSFAYPAQFVICVYAPRHIQIERIQKRNNLTVQEAMIRINSQIDIEIKKAKSNFVIDNSGDLKALQKNIESFLQEFLNHF